MIPRSIDDLLWAVRPNRVVHVGPEDGPRALFSYLNRPLTWDSSDPRMNGHSNKWESKEIARLLVEMGYSVMAVNFDDDTFEPDISYELFFDIHGNMQRLAERSHGAIKLLHMTGSYPRFQNAAEERWAREFEERTGVHYTPKRTIKDMDEFDRSMRIADRCSLIGNSQTVRSFPEYIQSKITTIRVSASPGYVKKVQNLPLKREFVWFFGTGAVHKGLDRTLEAFKSLPGSVLHVIGNVRWEKDFMSVYGDMLLHGKNIRYHGRLEPNSEKYREIIDRSVAFIAPSCSEGTSPAAATMMQAGLYPIISKETGVTLPDGTGTYLKSCAIDEIRQICEEISNRSEKALIEDISTCQRFALTTYSRSAFTQDMEAYLSKSLRKTNN